MPPAWERCKRCDADLASAAPRELVGAGARDGGPGRAGAPATFGAQRFAAPPPPPAAAPPAPPAPPAAAPFRAFEPTAPINVRDQFERLPTVGESWSSVAQAPTARRFPIVGILVLVAIVGSSWFAWKQATARHIPSALRPYVHDGDGVDYANPAGRFQVKLPVAPQELAQSFVVSGASMQVVAALSIVDEQVVGVAWFDVPSNLIAASDMDANLRLLAEGYATKDGDVLEELDYVSAEGYNAVDATFDRDGASGKVRVILAGTRVYVLVAGGTEAGAVGFEQLTGSFDIG